MLSPRNGAFYVTLLVDDNPIFFTLLSMGDTNDEDEWVRSLNKLKNDHNKMVLACQKNLVRTLV